MNPRKYFISMICLTLIALVLAGCGSKPAAPTAVPTVVPSAPPAVTAPAAIGYITGKVYLAGPPTPHMTVYAVDQATGKWASTETNPAEGEATYTLVVPPGTYQVFAFSDTKAYTAYSLDGWNLAVTNVAANQTVADIRVGPPGQSKCGSMFGVPASPDGKFSAVAGPDEACKATALTPEAPLNSDWQTIDNGQIQFQPNSTSWHTNGDLNPKTTRRFALYAQKGQQMIVNLVTDPAASAAVGISGADGKVLTNPNNSWSGTLPASQNYFIDVIAMTGQPVLYTLSVEIPAGMANPSSGQMYEPVSPSVCQIIQEAATQALAVNFTMEASVPFTDTLSGETGQGCRLTASGNGNNFASPGDVVAALVRGSGFTELPDYQADGPTGSATAATRDTALMLIEAGWKPSADAQCPSDQPIASCNLKPEQKLYTVQINTALYKVTYWLPGHWEDAATNFSLDLFQNWKKIYGHHTAVAQGGNKIDSLDVSIDGMVQGQVATVKFQSSFTSETGTAQITYVDANTITWKIITPPNGEYYLPAEATLVRK